MDRIVVGVVLEDTLILDVIFYIFMRLLDFYSFYFMTHDYDDLLMDYYDVYIDR